MRNSNFKCVEINMKHLLHSVQFPIALGIGGPAEDPNIDNALYRAVISKEKYN